ncbi:potential E3 ubiquitin-protein ligase ariadne-2-like isoform X2 [Stegostoma tigrinum]|uniref:potential E3 ubiquitin-protein ligase ariadne-2-like isoform X2 n=1 Tax=Stegostoma tigrinum TaxID=3053191 RepID=UPI00202B3BB1|nr:potential E3 ubiquitin-protein ligase ariadne-2-like isoform X2 [Stegostoma tigrinum]
MFHFREIPVQRQRSCRFAPKSLPFSLWDPGSPPSRLSPSSMDKPTGTIFYRKRPSRGPCRVVELPCKHFADEEKLVLLVKWSLEKCPACSGLVQRVSEKELMVTCPLCPGSGGKDHRFCWECLRDWKGVPGDRCGYGDCSSLLLLRSCSVINAPQSAVHQCPTVRSCPECHALLSHWGGCNNIVCPSCGCCFCYRCLAISFHHGTSCNVQPNPSIL